jgi:hypothetical protein
MHYRIYFQSTEITTGWIFGNWQFLKFSFYLKVEIHSLKKLINNIIKSKFMKNIYT